MGYFLEEIGFKVVTAVDGLEAQEKFKSENPDFLVTDLFMPGQSGLELAKRVWEHKPMTPIVIMTGSIRENVILFTPFNEVTAVIRKPYMLKDVVSVVEKALIALDEYRTKAVKVGAQSGASK
jgi:CheY-like chemotaxis protein